MRELLTMWRHSRMVMLVAVVAAIYAAVLLPFKLFTIIPGITSVRPANVFPVIFSIMFGPAAPFWSSGPSSHGTRSVSGVSDVEWSAHIHTACYQYCQIISLPERTTSQGRHSWPFQPHRTRRPEATRSSAARRRG